MRRWPILGTLIVLDLVEAGLLVTYDGSCWGFQPGGKTNMLVASGLAALFLAAAASAIAACLKMKTRIGATVIATALGAGAIIIAYIGGGWQMFTSIHNQGSEGLVLFPVMNAAIVLTLVAWPGKRKAEVAA